MENNPNPPQNNQPDQKPATQPASGPGSNGSSGLDQNIASLLCYLLTFVTGIIFLVIEKNDKEVRFHAWQAIFLGIASFAYAIAMTTLSVIFGAIAHFFTYFVSFISFMGSIGLMILWIIAMVKAYQGEHWMIPVIGPLAEQQNNKK